MPASHFPDVFEEVRLANILLTFRSGQNYIVDASTIMILINVERPIKMSNLSSRNNFFTNHASQHIVPFMEANSDNLSQSKLFPSCRLSFIFIWATLIVSCLDNIWSHMRCIFCNYFGCKNIKSGSKSFKIANSGKSEKEDKK